MPVKSEFTFTEQTVKAAKPKIKQYQHRDATKPGLVLRIYPSGKKSYLVEVERHVLRVVGDAIDLTPRLAWTNARKMQADHAAGKKIESKRKKELTLRDFIDKTYRAHARSECKNPQRGDELADRIISCGDKLLDKRLDELSEFAINGWKKRRQQKVKKTTVKRDLGALKTALSHATYLRLIPINPAANVQIKVEKDLRVRYLDSNERKRLLEALVERDKDLARARASSNLWRRKRGHVERPLLKGYADYLRPLTLLVLNTGLRKSEALTLTWANVNMSEQIPRLTVKAAHAKSGTTRYVPLNSEAIFILRQWKKQGQGKGLVFPNPITGERMGEIRSSWRNLMKKAEIIDFRFHDIRHDFASQLAMKGVDLYRIKDLLGHGSIEMTERYSHLSDEALAEAVEVLA